MEQNRTSRRLIGGVIAAVVVLLAAAIGAWQSISPSPTEAAEQRSAFVQSGGVATDVDTSVPDAAQALMHARTNTSTEAAASTF